MGETRHLNSYLASLQASAERTRKEIAGLVEHRAEKGRIVEEVIKGVLSRLLPKRFSVGTGFLISATGMQSGQTDIVIYDNIYNAPLLSEFSTYLFPVEAVYATFEVKSRLDKKELRSALAAIRKIREVGSNKRYRTVGKAFSIAVPPRSYVVCFEQSGLGRTFAEFQENLIDALAEEDDHVHGVCILENNWFAGREAHKKPPRLFGGEGNALAQLYSAVLEHQNNFAVYPMDHSAYLQDSPQT